MLEFIKITRKSSLKYNDVEDQIYYLQSTNNESAIKRLKKSLGILSDLSAEREYFEFEKGMKYTEDEVDLIIRHSKGESIEREKLVGILTVDIKFTRDDGSWSAYDHPMWECTLEEWMTPNPPSFKDLNPDFNINGIDYP